MSSPLYRQLPKVDAVLAAPAVAELPPAIARTATRAVLDGLRQGIGDGTLAQIPDVPALVVQQAQILLHGRLRPVINATGVVVHTNLGRAPWADEAIAAAVCAARAVNVQMDLDSGRRGGRLDAVRALMAHLVGAESALVVNNCAAAVLLALTAFARDRDVLVSRGELVEIGGSFRVPEVISAGGARMVEVGTTNRTRAADFEAAITPATSVLLRVHRSNFKVVGFTEEPTRAEMVDLAGRSGLMLLEDLGSGSLLGECGEPGVKDALDAGVPLVMFSGDKLLGGPQAGLIVGRADAIETLRRHPLYRALRVDKVTLAALEATLALHARGERPPTTQMIEATEHQLAARADTLAELLAGRGVACERVVAQGFVGGGSLPGQGLPGHAVTLQVPHPDRVARRLRTGEPAVVARIAEGRLWFDVRTVRDGEVVALADGIATALAER